MKRKNRKQFARFLRKRGRKTMVSYRPRALNTTPVRRKKCLRLEGFEAGRLYRHTKPRAYIKRSRRQMRR